jgi:hypothetical protein
VFLHKKSEKNERFIVKNGQTAANGAERGVFKTKFVSQNDEKGAFSHRNRQKTRVFIVGKKSRNRPKL